MGFIQVGAAISKAISRDPRLVRSHPARWVGKSRSSRSGRQRSEGNEDWEPMPFEGESTT